jgi:hypothetical protein
MLVDPDLVLLFCKLISDMSSYFTCHVYVLILNVVESPASWSYIFTMVQNFFEFYTVVQA